MFANWNYNLSAIRQAAREGAGKSPELYQRLRLAAKLTILHGKATALTSLNIEEAITFMLHILALEPRLVSPRERAETIAVLAKYLRRYLVFFAAVLHQRRSAFLAYLAELSAAVSKESLLYVYTSISPAQFKTWVQRLKKRLLRLVYDCVTSRLFVGSVPDEFRVWVKHWVDVGLLHEDKELRCMIGVSVAGVKSAALEAIVHADELKYKGKDIMEIVYTGEYSEICQSYIKRLSSKKEKQICEYILVFYELLVQLRNPQRRFQYFESQPDYHGFAKSYVYSMIEYFMMNLGFVNSYPSFVLLGDVLRLSSPYLSDSNRKQLLQLGAKFYGDIDTFRFQSEAILEVFTRAFSGTCFVQAEDEDEGVSAGKLGEKEISLSELLSLLKEVYEDEVTLYSIEERLRYTAARVGKASPEEVSRGIIGWAKGVTWTSPDDGKRLRRILYCLCKELGLVKPEDYERIRELIIKRLEEGGAKLVSRKDLCMSEDFAKRKLPSDGSVSLADICAFLKENESLVAACSKKLTDIAKALYESEKPSVEVYKLLSKTTKRLTETLQKDPGYSEAEAKLRIIGSAANGLWSPAKSRVDYTLVLEHRLQDLPTTHLVDRVPTLLKAGDFCDSVTITSPTLIEFTDKLTNTPCTLSLNRVLEVHAASLVLAYTKYDERCKFLAFFVKEWARCHGILGGPYLSSYGYLLLALHFLQSTSPPVLPCLQQLFVSKPPNTVFPAKFPSRNATELSETNVYFETKLDKVRAAMKAKSGNSKSVGELLAGFFRYYAYEFAYDKTVISVREGRTKEKTAAEDKIMIEDLFESGKYIVTPKVGSTEHELIKLKMRQAAIQSVQEPTRVLSP